VPRGGSSFLNEMDGNLTCWRDDDIMTLHWCGKFRGPDFEPLKFQLHTVKSEKIKDSKGRIIPSVAARHLDAEHQKKLERQMTENEDQLLRAIAENPNASLSGLAGALRWLHSKGEDKSKVNRYAEKLKKDGLVKKSRGKLELTERGQREVKRLYPDL
jgi:DNA-binding MarR family transcriptional regulator